MKFYVDLLTFIKKYMLVPKFNVVETSYLNFIGIPQSPT